MHEKRLARSKSAALEDVRPYREERIGKFIVLGEGE